MSSISRRNFMGLMGSGAAGVAVAPLSMFHARVAQGAPSFGVGFGPIAPALPQNTADLGPAAGVELLELPKGFKYWAHSITGSTMSDGTLVPGGHDGMAAFRGPRATHILVRNHELSNGSGTFVDVPDNMKFDTASRGGTTSLVIDQNGELVGDWASLGGTIRNCAGGPTPWESWITCEENTSTVGSAGNTQKHGYNFDVPAYATGPVAPVPLIAMGRFNHEAVAVDPRTGFVYQTEDRGDSAFYRFRPDSYGQLQSGVLEALVFKGAPNTDTSSGFLNQVGVEFPVEWVVIEEPDPAGDTVRFEAQAKGAAEFARGEGAWYGNGLIYFVCTSGGDDGNGQVWAYNPHRETIFLVVESTTSSELDNPDNVTVGPDGRLYLCEDGGGEQFVVGVNNDGSLYQVCRNNSNTSEFCGACFSHDGRFMFVNQQSPGYTFVIEGPWRKGQK